MTAKARPRQPVPKRHWRTSGNDPLPTPAEALAEPFAAFPRWLVIRDILYRMRHDGCGGRPSRAELLTGVEDASSRPVRRIVLIGG